MIRFNVSTDLGPQSLESRSIQISIPRYHESPIQPNFPNPTLKDLQTLTSNPYPALARERKPSPVPFMSQLLELTLFCPRLSHFRE